MSDELASGERTMDSRPGDEPKGSILWVDDDGPDRFMYERLLLKRSGWDTQWAQDVISAAQCLAGQSIAKVILDQVMPIQLGSGQETVWGGYLLLVWLRGASDELHPEAPPLPPELRQLAPLPGNRSVSVIIASAYYDDTVGDALRCLMGTASIRVVPKPLNPDDLMNFLEEAT